MENNVRPAEMARITTPALAQQFIEEQIEALRAQIGDQKVLLALSGGVDSSVVAALLIWLCGVSPVWVILVAIAGGLIYGKLNKR